jgi:hypothetical protein
MMLKRYACAEPATRELFHSICASQCPERVTTEPQDTPQLIAVAEPHCESTGGGGNVPERWRSD